MKDIPLSPQHRVIVAQCPLFIGDDGHILNEYLSCHHVTALHPPDGQPISLPPTFTRCLGIVLKGTLHVSVSNLSISVLGSSDLFGAATLYCGDCSPITTLTGQGDCVVLLLPAQDVETLIAQFPLIRTNYLRYLTGRIHFLSGRVSALGAGSAEGKLARHLLFNPQSNIPSIELAKRLGISRASLYRAFSALEESAVIARNGKSITVLNPAALSAYT